MGGGILVYNGLISLGVCVCVCGGLLVYNGLVNLDGGGGQY